jgi:ketosteroid isomerase-like protein
MELDSIIQICYELYEYALLQYNMSKFATPEELLRSQVKEFNKGNIKFLMTLYENDACFATKPRQVVKDQDSIRQAFQGFIDMGVKLDARAKRVLQTANLALLITEWSLSGTDTDGKPINLTGRGTIVLRRQADYNWLMVIENPWGTE